MKITVNQLRKIIKEEVQTVRSHLSEDRSVIGGKSYNHRVAQYVASDFKFATDPNTWLTLLDSPAFKTALGEWFKANEPRLDPGLPKAQLFY